MFDRENNMATHISIEEYIEGLQSELGWTKKEVNHLLKLAEPISMTKECYKEYKKLALQYSNFISGDDLDSYLLQMLSIKIYVDKLSLRMVQQYIR